MYPEGTLIDSNYKTLIVFEKDLNNPDNEGFVCYWDIDDNNIYKLIFKKRLSKEKAIRKFKNLLKDGWVNSKEKLKVA
tara:strand:+ start:183 stop:416 length:234 start_codon:yes stop_codon:yes gene_type:complete